MSARPFCAVCGVPVQAFEEVEGEEDVVWTARCHGDVERIRFTLEELRHSKVTGLGLAFDKSQRRLPDVEVGQMTGAPWWLVR